MCGITGYFHFNKDKFSTENDLKKMTRSMSHRGPNDSGCVVFNRSSNKYIYFSDQEVNMVNSKNNVGLGHRRLSILDLSASGRQPMSTANDKVWLILNGEIYNFIELRSELEKKCYNFKTGTDTEVVLKSYLEWGLKCFERFNGMWGLAIYDRRSEQLILSRDRFGKKPIYYYSNEDVLIFASEIKAIFKHPLVPKDINYGKVVDYAGRHYRYVDNDNETFFNNIFQVPKSTFMVFTASGEEKIEYYWKLDIPESSKIIKDSEAVEEFQFLLKDAIKIRLRSDVPVGSMLSGGLDSGSVTCIASKLYNNLHTFSGVTGDGYFDESEYIDEVVKLTGTKHTYIHQDHTNLFSILNEMLQFHDEPICTVTWLCNYVLSKQVAKSNIPVVLTGHGGDELLAGYWDHYHYAFADLRSSGKSDEHEYSAWLNNHGRDPDEYSETKKYIDCLYNDKNEELIKFSSYMSCLKKDILKYSKVGPFNGPGKGALNRRLYLEMFNETIPPSLRAEDRNMMAFSIENRVPFLDYRLANFCFGLDNSMKVRNGLGKWLIRESMKNILPEKVRLRKDKTGFNAPFDEWLRNDLKDQVIDMINSKTYINQEIYNIAKVRKKFQEHLNGHNHYMFFWQYININIWYSLNFNE